MALLRGHARVVPLVSDDLEAVCGISLAWYDVLFQLHCAPEQRWRMHELADAVLLSRSGLTRLVDRIEAAGLVARTGVPGDRRSLHVQLTPAGRRLVRRARAVVLGSVANRLGQRFELAELETLRDLLRRLIDAPASHAATP